MGRLPLIAMLKQIRMRSRPKRFMGSDNLNTLEIQWTGRTTLSCENLRYQRREIMLIICQDNENWRCGRAGLLPICI